MLEGLKLKAAIRRQRKHDEAMALPAESWDRREAESQLRTDEWEARRTQAHRERVALAEARKADRAAKRNASCQVCGRDILDNTGVIAHHGYQRPQDWHSQTASCAGARFVAYEVSCDRLKEVALGLAGWIQEREAQRAALNTPPASLTYQKRIPGSGYGRHERTEPVTVERPADFQDGDYYGIPGSYSQILQKKRADLDYTIRSAKSELAMMNSRIAAWVKVR